MRLKFGIVALCVAMVASLCSINSAEARGFGTRGTTSVRIGIVGNSNRTGRYYGPSFSMGPRVEGTSQQGATQLQQRPWYYSRSGPYEYYRPYRSFSRSR